MSDINTTTEGQVFTGISGGQLFDLFGLGPKKGFKDEKPVTVGFELPAADLALAKDQQRVQAQIDAATAAGVQPSALLFTQLETIEAQRDLLNRQFLLEQQRDPGIFSAVNVPPGTPLSFFINLFNLARPLFESLVGGPGQPAVGVGVTARPPGASPRLPPRVGGDPGAFGFPSRRTAPTEGPPAAPASRGFDANRFIKCLVASLLPTQGGTRMPFVVTPSGGAQTSGFGFGDFFGGVVDIAKRFLGPTVGPGTAFPGQPQQAAFPIIPAARALIPAARQFLPAFGGGVAGGLFEDFLGRTGGASTFDEAAAFTDPVPGRCRPKAHVKRNPCTDKEVWFVPRGRPLVFTGDMAACKRVDRVAKRLDKARPKRRHHHHAKRRPR